MTHDPAKYLAQLQEIRNTAGMRNQREGDVWPDSPNPNQRVLISCEARFKRVVDAMIDRGLHPGPGALLFCTWRAHNTFSGRGGGNLNGRETRWRREVLLARGYVKDETTGRWKMTAETRRSIDFRRHGLEAA